MKEKNGFKFKIENISAEIDEEYSSARSKETEKDIIVASFSVDIVEINEDGTRYPFELMGNIEIDEDGWAEAEFDDGTQYRSYLTLVGGDIIDAAFNAAVQDFFREDCDFNSLILLNLSDEERDRIQSL